jgi:hypothetical protein
MYQKHNSTTTTAVSSQMPKEISFSMMVSPRHMTCMEVSPSQQTVLLFIRAFCGVNDSLSHAVQVGGSDFVFMFGPTKLCWKSFELYFTNNSK